MADLASLQVQLELQTAQFSQQMGAVNSQLDKLNKHVNGVASTFKGLGAAIAANLSVRIVVDAFRNAANAMDEMGKSAQKLGIAVDELSALKYAANQSGLSFEQLSTGLRKLNQNMADVESGTSDAAKALRAMGVRGGDSPTEALKKIADVFQALGDTGQRTALAMEIFGKAGAEMIPMLADGAAGIDRMTKRAAELGLVLDEETTKQAERFNDALDDMQLSAGNIITQITVGMMPAFSNMAEAMAEMAKSGDKWKTVGGLIGEGLTELGVLGIRIAEYYEKLGAVIGATGEAFVKFFSADLAGAKKALTDLPANLDKIAASADKTAAAMRKIGEAKEKADESAGMDDAQVEAWLKGQAAIDGLKTKTKEATKAINDTNNALSPLEQTLSDLYKTRGDKQSALDTLLELDKLNTPEKLELLEISASDFADVMERLKKSAGVWTDYDEALKSIVEKNADIAQHSASWDVLVGKLESGAITLEEFNVQMEALEKLAPAIDEVGGAAGDMSDDLKKMGEEISTSIAANASNAMNDLIDSFGEAEVSFGDLISAMLKDLAKLVVQLLIVKPLMDSIGGFFAPSAMGNAFAGATGLPHGVYTRPTFFSMPGSGPLKRFAQGGVLGEAGPEAILPLSRNAQGKLGVTGTGVQVNVYNNADVEVSTKESQGPDGQQVIDMFIDRRINEKFGNGSMDKIMRNNYGLNRYAGA